MTEAVLISVRVQPRAHRDELVGFVDGALRVRLRAPPVEGRANDSLLRLLADRLGLPLTAVELVSGETARSKRVRIHDLSGEEVRRRLGLSE